MPPKKRLKIALAGNPNTGKSTLFNALTGGRQSIGNWPGKTVEKKTGKLKHGNASADIIDLPGIYSITPYSIEEAIARNFIVEEGPDVVIDIVDASNLERNLYLAVQLRELGANIVIALNMMDVAHSRGFKIDVKKLSRLLGVPVVPTVANKKEGIKGLVDAALRAAGSPSRDFSIDYGADLEPKIRELQDHICRHARQLAGKYGARWLAVKLIERDPEISGKVCRADDDICTPELEEFITRSGEIYGEDADVEIAERRYAFINGVVRGCMERPAVAEATASDRIDNFVTNKYIGIPVFLALMYLMYQLVFIAGAPFVSLIESGLAALSASASSFLAASGSPEWVSTLIVSGILGGIGNVLVFVPNILLLFLAIAILEDSGYMARAAFVMDRLMARFGLHGKSFISIIVGFGCNVPAIMSARTIEDEKYRIVTVLVNMLVPCSARMAVFVFIAGAFFAPEVAAQAIWSLILLSLVLIMLLGYLFKKFLLPGPRAPFVIELPAYRAPTLRALAAHTLSKTWLFISKAGTFIFAVAVLIWFLASFPEGAEYGSSGSYIGMLGHALSPALAPLGFDWKGSVALLFGLAAKEVVISAFGVLYDVSGEGTLQAVLAREWTPLQAYVFMVFTLIYVPCFATLAAIRKETGSWGWVAFTVAYSIVLAWAVSFAVLQAGHMMGYA